METIIKEVQIFGPTSAFASYLHIENIVIDQHENYQKRSFRNRYNILTSNGPMVLSVPLEKGKNNAQNIKDVKIAYHDRWTDIHLQTIRSAYGKSPYFDYYYDGIENIINSKYKYLFDLDIHSLLWALRQVRIDPTIEYSTQYFDLHPKKQENIADSTKIIGQNTAYFAPYIQVWSEKFDFIPNLSILDLLFCSGPEARSVLSIMNQ